MERILKTFKGKKVYIGPDWDMFFLKKRKFSLSFWQECKSEGDFKNLCYELLLRKYNYKMLKSYLSYNKDILNLLAKGTSEIDDNDIKNYLVHLAEEQVATSKLNPAINALEFFYGTLQKKKFPYDIKRPRKDRKLPVILSQKEVTALFSFISSTKLKAILMIAYSTSLRVSEAIRFRLEDIASHRKLIFV